MIKYFCDVCGDEFAKHGRIARKLGDVLMVEVMVRYKSVWNAGDICQPCVIKAVTYGMDADPDEQYPATWRDHQ